MIGAFRERIMNGDSEGTTVLTKEAVEQGVTAEVIVNEYLMPVMDEVGRLYEQGEIFIPEMLMAARAMQGSMAILRPLMAGDEERTSGRAVIGTVEGDLHDIGKTLVSAMLEGTGFDVHDLGIDVKPDAFVKAVRELKPAIVAMSAMLTTTMTSMKVTIEALKEAGLREGVTVMVGGAPLTSEFARSIGADAYCEDAASGARKAKELLAHATTRSTQGPTAGADSSCRSDKSCHF